MPHKDLDVRRAYHRAYQRAWRSRNLEKSRAAARASVKACRLRHPERYQASLETIANRYTKLKSSAKRRGIAFDLTLEQYTSIIGSGICHYCEGPMEKTGSGLDRKDNLPIYTADTVVPCCGRCNRVFNAYFSYEEKLILAPAIRQCDRLRAARKTTPPATRSSHVREPPTEVQGLLFQ